MWGHWHTSNPWAVPSSTRIIHLQVSWSPSKDRRIKVGNEQVLIDKVVGKLPNWKGKLLNKAVWLTLIKSVLTSVVIYHMTVFPLSKWAIKKIDKIRPSFLWQGNEDVRGGHCLVNWKQVQWVKKLGGLGVLDLARFNRALRLRWRRYQ
jgi:hypothetical protein